MTDKCYESKIIGMRDDLRTNYSTTLTDEKLGTIVHWMVCRDEHAALREILNMEGVSILSDTMIFMSAEIGSINCLRVLHEFHEASGLQDMESLRSDILAQAMLTSHGNGLVRECIKFIIEKGLSDGGWLRCLNYLLACDMDRVEVLVGCVSKDRLGQIPDFLGKHSQISEVAMSRMLMLDEVDILEEHLGSIIPSTGKSGRL